MTCLFVKNAFGINPFVIHTFYLHYNKYSFFLNCAPISNNLSLSRVSSYANEQPFLRSYVCIMFMSDIYVFREILELHEINIHGTSENLHLVGSTNIIIARHEL